jgi:hypothetical protein
VPADQAEQPAPGLAAPALLAQVRVVRHAAVELVQLVAVRQLGLLDRAALAARPEVPVLSGAVVRGGECVWAELFR